MCTNLFGPSSVPLYTLATDTAVLSEPRLSKNFNKRRLAPCSPSSCPPSYLLVLYAVMTWSASGCSNLTQWYARRTSLSDDTFAVYQLKTLSLSLTRLEASMSRFCVLSCSLLSIDISLVAVGDKLALWLVIDVQSVPFNHLY